MSSSTEQSCSKRSKKKCDQQHEEYDNRNQWPTVGAETKNHCKQKHDQSPERRDGRPAKRSSDHDIQRETGATRVSLRKPNCRSQIIECQKISAVKMMLIPTMPGAKNWK